MALSALPSFSLRRASVDDAPALAALAQRTFVDTFAPENTAENMSMYLATALSVESQRVALADNEHAVYLAEANGEQIGYVMLRDHTPPSAVGAVPALEIARLYCASEYKGTGVGSALMQRALDEAAARGKDVVWLGVWERNPAAIAFYSRWGFEDVGSHTFTLGDDIQSDRLMRRAVPRVPA